MFSGWERGKTLAGLGRDWWCGSMVPDFFIEELKKLIHRIFRPEFYVTAKENLSVSEFLSKVKGRLL